MDVEIFHSNCDTNYFSFNVLSTKGLRLSLVFRLAEKPGSAYEHIQDCFLRVAYLRFEMPQFNHAYL